MAKKLEVIVREAIDINRITKAIRVAGYKTATERKAKKSLPFSGTMAELRIAPDRLEKQADGWFKDRFLFAYYGRDYFWSSKAEEKHLDWNAGEAHGKALEGMQPSIFDLQSLKDYTKSKPCILDCVKVLEISTDDYYWTRETTAWGADSAWIVTFHYGDVYNDGKDSSCYVRPVRSSK